MAFDFDELELAESERRQPSVLDYISDSRQTRMSRARVWFEIKRCFEADTGHGCADWKARYARELLLRAIKEALQRDGFVVIDAALPANEAQQLAKRLKLPGPAPEVGAAAVTSAPHNSVEAKGTQSPQWVGSHLSRSQASTAPVSLESYDSKDLSPPGQICEVSFADSKGCTSIRPYSKAEFINTMKVFVHVAADNSVSEAQLPVADKVSVQFSFGDQEALQKAREHKVSQIETWKKVVSELALSNMFGPVVICSFEMQALRLKRSSDLGHPRFKHTEFKRV